MSSEKCGGTAQQAEKKAMSRKQNRGRVDAERPGKVKGATEAGELARLGWEVECDGEVLGTFRDTL